MNLWIVTIGSSDVQLIGDKENQAKGRTEKQRSDKVWRDWYTSDLKEECYDISKDFEPKVLFQGQSYRAFARVLGKVYQAASDVVRDKIWDYLTFPLLENFVQELQNSPAPEAIVVLLTDQSKIFEREQQRKPNSPYWQDTCELEPILQCYFAEKFPGVSCEFIPLIPQSKTESLDNWNAVLDLVRKKFRNLTIDEKPIQINPGEIVYVSHQAGTPAISSAVQFCSLAKFGDRVKFLVSNEYNPTFPEKPLEGSSYLRGIRIQEAKALLGEGSYNYAAVEALIGDYIQENEEIKALLNAAKNWNVARFTDFLNSLKNYPKFTSEVTERTGEKNWWWLAYEEAYLAVIREKQDNIVEAFFHSFRAFEYIFVAWSDHEFGGEKEHIEKDKGKSYLKKSVLSDKQDYFAKAKFKQNGDPKDDLAKLKCRINDEERVLLDLSTIHKLFRACRDEYTSECLEIQIFWDQKNNKESNVSEKRNTIIHQVCGMSKDDLQACWTAREESDQFKDKSWEEKLPIFLNFIIQKDFPEGFATLEEASLMAKVHQELKNAIEQL
ncbi:hypothetical protein ACN4EG_17650 [Alkalinema pantanalense CENA528]|uniref:hypothetical protein n=1 Tax=Alkalinema pantanalense TaxID=1620705 RepID=UPI003D6FA674